MTFSVFELMFYYKGFASNILGLFLFNIFLSDIFLIIFKCLIFFKFFFLLDQITHLHIELTKKAKIIKKMITAANKTKCKKVTNTWDISTNERQQNGINKQKQRESHMKMN